MSSSYIYQLLTGLGLSERYAIQMLPRVKMTNFDVGRVIWPKGGPVQAWKLDCCRAIVKALRTINHAAPLDELGFGASDDSGVLLPLTKARRNFLNTPSSVMILRPCAQFEILTCAIQRRVKPRALFRLEPLR